MTIELIPHCESTSPHGWTGDHDLRPLTETGAAQAQALVSALGSGLAAIYSSPALRCLQTVRPLADALALPIAETPDLLETRGFAEPREWTEGVYEPVGQALGGAWSAGKALRALDFIANRHPGQRVAACSHGDVIPALLAMLCAAYDRVLPPVVGRGGRHTLRFEGRALHLTAHHPS
jgi:8-oxo-dGTP diphosphatase